MTLTLNRENKTTFHHVIQHSTLIVIAAAFPVGLNGTHVTSLVTRGILGIRVGNFVH